MRSILAFLLCFIGWLAQASSPAVRFDRLSLSDGLSQSAVAAIYQDSQGFMWFGTEDGLNRYDGYEFKVYKYQSDDDRSISGNHIKAIFEDKDGYLWIGTLGSGLNRYDRVSDTFTRFIHDDSDPNSLADNTVWSIVQDGKGQLWVATEGGISRLEGNGFHHYRADSTKPNRLSHNNVRTLLSDPDGVLWAGTYGGGLNRIDTVSGQIKHYKHIARLPGSLSNDKVLRLYRDGFGELWVGTESGGLNRFLPATGRFEHFRFSSQNPYSLSSNEVWDMAQDDNGTLWVVTQGGGLNRFDRQLSLFTHYRFDSAQPASLSNDNLWTIYRGNDGLMWIGSNGGGVNKFDIKRERFGHFRHDGNDPYSLSHNSVFSFLSDSQQRLWIGTDVGLNRFDAERNRFVHYFHQSDDPNSLSHNWAMSLYQDSKDRLWIGTLGGGLNRLEDVDGHFSALKHDPADPNSISDDRISVIFEDRQGILWVGTLGGGLNRYDEQHRRFIRYQLQSDNPASLSHNSIMSINQGPDGDIWVGTFDGLNRLDKQSGKFTRFVNQPDVEDSISNNFITAIVNDKYSDKLWLGTYGGGLNLFDRKSGKAQHFRQTDGLANDSIYGVLFDDSGQLWVSTNQGLSKFDPAAQRFQNFGMSDGLQSNEFNGLAYYKSPKGELFFGGIDGFNRFDPKDITPDSSQPVLRMTDFLVFNQSVKISDTAPSSATDFTLPKTIDHLDKLVLTHQQSLISFEFAALAYNNADKVRYAYHLDGFHHDWIETTAKNRRATFTGLAPGDYRLRVKASDSLGVWRGEQLSLQIKVLPPPWLSWWAYTLYFLAICSFLYALYWVQRYYARAKLQLLANTQLRQIMQGQLLAGQNQVEDDYAKFNLLVVDDDPAQLELLHSLLNGGKYQVTTALSGEQALELVGEECPFDLLLLDVNMPKLSGYQVCQKLREKYAANDLPVIFMTEAEQLNEIMESFAVGANDFISKPFSEPDLLNRIDTQLKLLEIKRNLTQSNQSIRALSEMCAELSSILDLDQLMDRLYNHIKELMDADCFALGVYNRQAQTIDFHLSLEEGRYLPDYHIPMSDKNRASVWCVTEQKPMIINDYDVEYSEYFGSQTKPQPIAGKMAQSFVYWPLITAGRLVGVLSIQSYRKNAYHKYQIKTIKTLASTTAIALDNARAYQALELQKQAIEDKVAQRTKDLEHSNQSIRTLAEICTEISTTLDFNQILHTVYRRIKALMDADIFMIGLIDEQKQHIEFKLAIKWDNVMPPFVLNLADEERAAIYCINQQKPMVINDLRQDLPKRLIKLPLHSDDQGREIESFMYYPLIVHNQVIGVLTVQSYRHQAYNEHQQDMIGTIASTTAVALDNAHAYRELEQKNNQILATQKQLIQSENLASLGTLTAGIAHEINNPTNFVHVSSQNLEVDLASFQQFIFDLVDDGTDEEIIESFKQRFAPLFDHINTIKEGTDRIKSIVKDLRGFSYLDTDEKSDVEVTEMLGATINLAKTKYGELADFETDFHCQSKLNCYPAQLNQVFMNLIVNACDAIRDKQRQQQNVVRGHVVIGCYCRENEIDITVKDNGCGMDEQTMEKLFLPFYTTKPVGEGTGLGLSISYNIVQKHGGELTAKSEVGRGTEFRLRLPLDG